MTKKSTKKETFGFLGEDMQPIILKAIIEDDNTFITYHNYINPNYFTVYQVAVICGAAIDFFREKKRVPTWNDLAMIISSKNLSEIEFEEYKSVFKILRGEPLEGMETAKELALAFCRQQEYIKLNNKMKKAIEGGAKSCDEHMQDIVQGITEVMKPKVSKIAVTPQIDIDQLAVQANIKIPTGVEEIDAVLNGGLEKGRVGLLVAKTGVGKTTLSTIFAVGAIQHCYKVLHITFEDTVQDITKKMIARTTGHYINAIDQTNAQYADIKAKFEPWKPYMQHYSRILALENQKETWEEIEQYISNTVANGFNPDLIIIDYFDCIKHSSNKNTPSYEAANRCIKKIEAFVKRTNVALWLTQQTNRDGGKSATKSDRMANLQGCYGVVQTAAVAMYLDKSDEPNRASLYIDKNRQGDVTSWEDFYFNNGILGINLKDVAGFALDENPNTEKAYQDRLTEFETYLKELPMLESA